MMKTTTLILLDWAIRCFGEKHVYDGRVRSLRLAEEAVELAQACNVPRASMHQLVDVVYSRPHGAPQQELGGVLLTSTVFAAAIYGLDPDRVLEAEMRRVLAKPVEHFTKRNEEKIALGLTGESNEETRQG